MCRTSSRCLLPFAAAAVVLDSTSVSRLSAEDENADRIEPYAKNPRYWQYEGKPVMLLGGNRWDAPFFVQAQRSVYDDLQAAGGNYLRYILKQRQDDSGQVTMLVRIFPFRLRWIDIAKGGYTGAEQTLTAGGTVTIATPGSTTGGWAAVITRSAAPAPPASKNK